MREDFKNRIEEFKKESDKLRAETKEKIVGYMATAFGLIAGLAWNDAVKALIEYFYQTQANSVLIKFLYAFIITVIVALVTYFLTRFSKNVNKADI